MITDHIKQLYKCNRTETTLSPVETTNYKFSQSTNFRTNCINSSARLVKKQQGGNYYSLMGWYNLDMVISSWSDLRTVLLLVLFLLFEFAPPFLFELFLFWRLL